MSRLPSRPERRIGSPDESVRLRLIVNPVLPSVPDPTRQTGPHEHSSNRTCIASAPVCGFSPRGRRVIVPDGEGATMKTTTRAIALAALATGVLAVGTTPARAQGFGGYGSFGGGGLSVGVGIAPANPYGPGIYRGGYVGSYAPRHMLAATTDRSCGVAVPVPVAGASPPPQSTASATAVARPTASEDTSPRRPLSRPSSSALGAGTIITVQPREADTADTTAIIDDDKGLSWIANC